MGEEAAEVAMDRHVGCHRRKREDPCGGRERHCVKRECDRGVGFQTAVAADVARAGTVHTYLTFIQ